MAKKYLAVTLAFALVVFLSAAVVIASEGKISEEKSENKNFSFEKEDSEAWDEKKVSNLSEDRVNELRNRHEERAKFRELMQEAREAGDYETVQELREEFGRGKGHHNRNANMGECLRQ